MPDIVSISDSALRADISATGAELVRLQDGNGRDLLWDGDPAFWTGRAPLLFPLVGGTKGNRIRVGGVEYPISRHGFARTSRFEPVSAGATACTWRLDASEETRRHYPFDFRLDVTYRLDANKLHMVAEVTNRGDGAMPASFGFHPALRWPLPYGKPREVHEIVFERDEPKPVKRLRDNLLSAVQYPSPVHDRHLPLADDLFRDDALIFDEPASRSVLYGAVDGPSIRVSFPRMPHLGIWSKPGAGFVCIEPWHGYASPEDFDGELADKPGMVLIAPGTTQAFDMTIALEH